MIKASELRIGNLIIFEPTMKISRVCPVKRIENKKILVIDRGLDLLLSDTEINPIHLTPEILEKAGFTKDEQYFQSPEYDFTIKSINDTNTHFMLVVGVAMVGVFIKHLHQLQNLYWCLTGEELIINI